MYFARNEFIPEPTTADDARQGAAEARELAQRYLAVELDGTLESLALLDQVLAGVRRMLASAGLAQTAAEPFARPFGFYLGEVIRAENGGEWGRLRIYSDRVEALLVGDGGP